MEKQISDFDSDKDGKVTSEEVVTSTNILEIELREQKALTQKRISWVALFSIIIFTGLLYVPLLSIEKIQAMAAILNVFYISMASIIGFYFGATAYMSK